MALEKTFRALNVALRRLNDRIAELRLTVVEDRPEKNDASLIDNFEYAVEDMAGWMREMLQFSNTAQQAVGRPLDLDQARRQLASCQEHFKRVERAYSQNLVSWERMNELATFGKERRGEWRSWVLTVQRGVEHCRAPLEEVSASLAGCWEEIAERVGMTSITMQTNIGTQASGGVPANGAVPQLAEEFADER